VPERVGRMIEVASLVIIGACILLYGWIVLRNAAHFPLAASIVLIVLGIVQVVALRRNRAAAGAAYPLRATRDVAFIAATFFALLAVNGAPRWTIGSCVATAEFGLLFELLSRFGPAASAL
jgi:hypothetical protein